MKSNIAFLAILFGVAAPALVYGQNVPIGPFELAIEGQPTAKFDHAKNSVHVTYNYSWKIDLRLIGKTVAKGNGKLFELDISKAGGTAKGFSRQGPVQLTYEVSYRNRRLRLRISGKAEFAGHRKSFRLFDGNVQVK